MKVKLTDLNSGQESLVLVTKINLKGLLVQTIQTLPIETPVHLLLTLSEKLEPLQMRGEIYKIAEKSSGQKGMVIRFINPTRQQIQEIQKALVSLEKEETQGSSQDYTDDASNRTMVASEDTLSKLSFSAPPPQQASKGSKKVRSVSSTVDEESASVRSDFHEETRMVAASEVDSLVRKTKKKGVPGWFYFLGFVIFMGASVIYFLPKFSPKLPISDPSIVMPSTPTSPPLAATANPPTEEEQQNKAEPAPPPVSVKRPAAGELKKVSVEETPGFIKIELLGEGLSRPEVSRLMSPKRLSVDFRSVKNFSNDPAIAVGKLPLQRVRTTVLSGHVQVVLDLYPVDFPRYDVKSSVDGVNIYLYR